MSEIDPSAPNAIYEFRFRRGSVIRGRYRGRINAGEYYYYIQRLDGKGPGKAAYYNVKSIDSITRIS